MWSTMFLTWCPNHAGKRCAFRLYRVVLSSLRWRHNDHAGVSNHQPHGCLLNRLFRHKSKKTSKLRVTGLCAGNSPGTGEFPAQMASYAENVSIWWRHHDNTVDFSKGTRNKHTSARACHVDVFLGRNLSRVLHAPLSYFTHYWSILLWRLSVLYKSGSETKLYLT